MDHDPWLWTALQVANFFRNDASDVVRDKPNSKVPDWNQLAQILEDNEVAGGDLLTLVDKDFLKDECGIDTLAKRSSVVFCISRLKSISDGYRRKDDAPGLSTPISVNAAPAQPPQLLQQPLPASLTVAVSTHNLDRTGSYLRPGEQIVKDGRGRKRRKLELQAPVTKPEVTVKARNGIPAGAFMADSSHPIDELFYGNTQFNRPIEELEPLGEIVQNPEADEADTEFFQAMPADHPYGDVSYVYRQIKHLLVANTEQKVRRRGRDAVAIFPYRETLLPASKAVSATVFVPSEEAEEGVVAVRENAKFLNEDVDYYNIDGAEHAMDGTWDYLTEKYGTKDGEIVIPVEAWDEDDDMSSSLEREIELEQNELKQDKNERMDLEEVESAIEEAICDFVRLWKDNRLPRYEEKQAWTVWKKMKGSKRVRDNLIADAQARIRGFDARLKKMKGYILDDEWRTEKSLKQQCESMLPTVEDRELDLWKISVWRRTQEPFHVVRHGQHTISSHPNPTSTVHGPRFVVEATDRLNAEPGEVQHEEVFHTPQGSKAGDEDMGDEGDDEQEDGHETADEMQMDTFKDKFVISDSSPPLVDTPTRARIVTPDLPGMDSSPFVQKQSSYWKNPTTLRRSGDSSEVETSPEKLLPDLPKISQRPKPVFKTPTKAALVNSQANPIVLSPDDDSDTPTRRKSSAKKTSSKRGSAGKITYSSDPMEDAQADVNSWTYEELARNNDRMRFLIKMMADLGPEKRSHIHVHKTKLRQGPFMSKLQAALGLLRKDLACKAEDELFEIELLCARLYLAYTQLDESIMLGATKAAIPWVTLINTLQLNIFGTLLDKLAKKKDSKLFKAPNPNPKALSSSVTIGSSPRSVIELDTDEEADEQTYQKFLQETPRKKRRRVMPESQAALQSQNVAKLRLERYKEAQQATDSQQLVAMIQRNPTSSKISVNIGKDDEQDAIYVHQPIAQAMKGHQIEGVQFMWRELTATDDDVNGPQGCLLTHTMGLGKTMQTIAVLVALNEAAQSTRQKVYTQLPSQLRTNEGDQRQLRMVILCPPALLDNWKNEVDRWAGNALPHVFIIESEKSYKKGGNHLEIMRTWYKLGGVLIVGYSMYRNLIHRKASKDGKPNKYFKEGDEIDRYLQESPEILVADEVHNLKNPKSAVSMAVQGVNTESRIGLSGTPLSNRVDEIYALISFVAPGYLGEPKEFAEHYANPIEQGLYDDSTSYEKRRALMKLRVLHKRIEPKVNRADINSLRGYIPPKTEFVLTLPLTEVQQIAYCRFVATVLGDKSNEKASQVQIFGWLGCLGLLTAHPLAFRKKLLTPARKKKNSVPARESSPDDGDGAAFVKGTAAVASPGDAQDNTDYTEELVLGFDQQTAEWIVSGITEDLDPLLSVKTSLLLDVIELSRQCNDKVLVFSGSLITLTTCEELLRARGIRSGRIDGSVEPAKRQQVITDFNKSDKLHVLMCSTRASGVGLNIQSANRVVILDFGFNPTHEEQAVGRAYRLGQEKATFVYRFVMGNTFEQHMYNTQLYKTALFQRVVDRRNPRRQAKKSARQFLFEPHEVVQQDVEQWIGKDPKVLDRILRRNTSVRAVTTYETLQQEDDEKLTVEEERAVAEELKAAQAGKLLGVPTSVSQALAAGVPVPVMGWQRQGRNMQVPPSTLPNPNGNGNGNSNSNKGKNEIKNSASQMPHLQGPGAMSHGLPTEAYPTHGLPLPANTTTTPRGRPG